MDPIDAIIDEQAHYYGGLVNGDLSRSEIRKAFPQEWKGIDPLQLAQQLARRFAQGEHDSNLRIPARVAAENHRAKVLADQAAGRNRPSPLAAIMAYTADQNARDAAAGKPTGFKRGQ